MAEDGVNVIHGVRMIAADCAISMCYRRTGDYEPVSMAAWKAACGPGKVTIDIGAYTGIYSIVAAKLKSTVIAFEPNPSAFRRLLKHSTMNSAKILAFPRALSDVDNAKYNLEKRRALASNARIVEGDTKNDGVTATLDTFMRRNFAGCCGQVAAIKIDVEGHEPYVLAGARGIIAANKPVIIAEALNDEAADIVRFELVPKGYKWRVADKRNLIFEPK